MFDSSSMSLDDLSDIIGAVLNQQGDQLSSDQRSQLRQRQNQIEQARQGNRAALDQNKEGLLDDIIRIAGPVVAGYVLRMVQERITGGRSESSSAQSRPPATPQYGTYREDDAVHRSGPGGQSVEEVE
jgi:hypothetical protein